MHSWVGDNDKRCRMVDARPTYTLDCDTRDTQPQLSSTQTAQNSSNAQPPSIPIITMSSMKAYLAEKYMSGPKADAILSRAASKKKKKHKPDDAGSTASSRSAMIVDDDAGWGDPATPTGLEEDDAAEAVVASDRAFKKRRMEPGGGGGEAGASGWTTVREPTPPPAADEQPVVVETTTEEAPPAFRGGLLTRKDLRTALPTSRDRQKANDDDPEAVAAAQETVYRDASGRKIDMKLERAEAARLKREREEREAQKMEWGKGLVQREGAEKRRREEERIRLSGFTRYASDEELNRAQKDQERWNDPAAAFMTVRFSPLAICRVLHFPADTPDMLYRKREQRALGNPNTRVPRLPRTGSESSLDIGGMASVS